MRESAGQNPRQSTPDSHPRAPILAETSEGVRRHFHQIAVETGPDPVHLTIGRPATGDRIAQGEFGPADPSATPVQAGGSGHAPIPGGFAKLFNRVIDGGYWGALPDAARAVYVPMVRFAEARDGFRVRVGLASLMRYTSLSRSSVKRALRALLEARLIAIVRAGGVAPDGTNRTNVYQLLLPEPSAPEELNLGLNPTAARRTMAAADSRRAPHAGHDARGAGARGPGTQSAARAKRGSPPPGSGNMPPGPAASGNEGVHSPPIPSAIAASSISSWGDCVLPVGSPVDPLPTPTWPPALLTPEPGGGSRVVPRDGRPANPGGGSSLPGPGATADPLHRATKNWGISEVTDDELSELDDMMPEGKPLLSQQQQNLRRVLEAWGVDSQVAQDVVLSYTREQIVHAVSSARQAKSRGGLLNPAGYIVRCLDSRPGRVALAAPATSIPDLPASAQTGRQVEEQQALAARAAADARIDELDDGTLSRLTERVLAMHSERPAMMRLLSARPPRESRLMRAEIAALLDV